MLTPSGETAASAPSPLLLSPSSRVCAKALGTRALGEFILQLYLEELWDAQGYSWD